jgi:hypothetical protein
MLNSFTRGFEYAEFERRLRHYFSDSAPINADIVLGCGDVRVSCPSGTISCNIEESVDIKENVKRIIDACTASLFPKMAVAKIESLPFTAERKKKLLMQGFSVEQIHEKEQRRAWVWYVLIRFNGRDSTIDYIEEATGVHYRARLYQPLMLIKDKIWGLSCGGREGALELYRFLMSVSKQEALVHQKNKEGECGIHEF